MSKIVKVAFEEHDVAILDRQAQASGVSRAEVIVVELCWSNGQQFPPQDYQRLVSDICRRVNLPRAQVERAVNLTLLRSWRLVRWKPAWLTRASTASC